MSYNMKTDGDIKDIISLSDRESEIIDNALSNIRPREFYNKLRLLMFSGMLIQVCSISLKVLGSSVLITLPFMAFGSIVAFFSIIVYYKEKSRDIEILKSSGEKLAEEHLKK